MFSHLREASLCEWRGLSITLGYFINRTAGARLPDLLPPPAACKLVCVCLCTSACVSGRVYVCVLSVWRPNGRQQPELWENWQPAGLWRTKNRLLLPQPAAFQRKLWKAVCCAAGYWRQSGRASPLLLSLQRKKKKERRRPSGLTAPFILYYPAWLLTPGELCSQIDALLLWGCSWNIKLYWNIHMWVHLAESNWCATPQTLNGNVAGPRHALADTLSYGHWDEAKASKSDPSGRPPVSARLMSESAPCPENIWSCAAKLQGWKERNKTVNVFFFFNLHGRLWWTLHWTVDYHTVYTVLFYI